MSVMSVSTVTMPLASSRTRAADFVTGLPRNEPATPMPNNQRPSRTLPGCALRLFQPNRSRALAQAFHELALRERPAGFLGIVLRVVHHAELERIEPEFFRHLVHRDFHAMEPGASPGARIALPSGRSSTDSRVFVMRLAPA